MQSNYSTYENYLSKVRKNGLLLQFVPIQFKTEEICFEAYAMNPKALRFIPNQWKERIQDYFDRRDIELWYREGIDKEMYGKYF